MKIAILGSRGRLGASLIRNWSAASGTGDDSPLHEVHGFARPALDLLDPATIDR